MTEFYVELQDADGTCYGTTDHWSGEDLYFEDLDEARMYAKGQLVEDIVLARVIESGRNRVIDFFEKK